MAKTPPPFATFTDTELADAIVRRVYEANLMIRAAVLRGMRVQVDLVERKNPAYPKGYTEVQAEIMGQRV